MKTAEDSHRTTGWAIAPVAGIAVVVSGQHFMLANRVTGRAHALYFGGGGFTLGVDFDVSRKLDYTSFRTRRAVNFDDFSGKAAMITAIKATVFVGYSKTILTIWEGSAFASPPLAKISWGGLELGKVGLQGQAGVQGFVGVRYGNGDPLGLIVREIDPAQFPDPVSDEPRLSHIKVAPHEAPLMSFPDEVLFGFDSATIKPAATPLLERAMDLINSRDRGQVVIEGHTDSVGTDRYNKRLSLRRANAVKSWFMQRKVPGAHAFIVRGMGESKPIEPNRLPTGADNPEGRAKNRRVEIHFR